MIAAKICIVSQYFPPIVIGGGEYAALMTAKGLAKHGNNVYVLTMHPHRSGHPSLSSEVPIYEVKENIAIRRILGVKILKIGPIDLTAFCLHELFFIYTFLVLLRFIRTEKPDVIHALNIDSIPPSVVAAKICRIPVVATVNSNAITCPKGDRLNTKEKICIKKCCFSSAKDCLVNKWESRPWRMLLFFEAFLWWLILTTFIKHVDKVIAVSNYILYTLLRNGVKPQKIVVIPEMMDSTILRLNKDKSIARKNLGLSDRGKVVLFGGFAFDFRKGSNVLLKAIPVVLKRMPHVKFIITGNVPSEEMRTINSSDFKQKIFLTGPIPRSKMLDVYAAADIVVFPSVLPEPFGLVLVEALYMKRPVIASKVGGIKDVIKDKQNGILINPNDPYALAAAIVQLLNNKKLIERLGDAGRETVEKKFCENAIIPKIIKVYQGLVKE
jgi:glycosyltransferase involved in cell wall biosynthesis